MNTLSVLARVLLVLPFLLSGINKITGFDGTVQYATSVGMPLATVAIIFAIIIEIVAPILVIVGKKFAGSGAIFLIIFTVVATYFFHNFWAMPAEMQMMQQIMFMKNLAIIGGLLLLFVQYRETCPLYCYLSKCEKKK